MQNLMSNFSGLAMSRMEMKNVKGGDLYACQCNGVGTWTGNYSSSSGASDAIAKYCRNGGVCGTNLGNKPNKNIT